MKRLILLLVLALVPSFAVAQQAAAQTFLFVGPTSQLTADVNAPTVAVASTLTWTATVDALAPKALTPVTCALISPAPVPPLPLVRCSTLLNQIPEDGLPHTVILTATAAPGVSGSAPPLSYNTATLAVSNPGFK